MAAVAVHILNQNLGRVRLERDTIVAIVYDTLLDDNIAAAVRIPAIGILRHVLTLTIAADVDAVEDNVRGVLYEAVVLRRIPPAQVGDGATVEFGNAEQDRS